MFGLVILILANALIREERIVILLLGLLTGGTLMLLALLPRQLKVQLAMRQNESRFRALSAMGSDWYWETDTEHRLTQVSEGLLRLSGRTESEYVGKPLWEIPFCAPIGSNWIQHQAVIAEKTPFTDLCLRYLSPAGVVGYADFSGEPVFRADGEFKGYRGVGNDMTVEMLLRQQLRMQYDVMRTLSQTNNAESAYLNVIETVCRTMEWDWGARRHLDPETMMLSCREHWLAPGIEAEAFVAATMQTKRASIETSTATRAMRHNEIVWRVENRMKDLRRGASARAANLHGIVSIPIVRGTETTDSLEFFSTRPEVPNQVLRETLAAVGQELAQFLDRMDARLALEQSEARFRAVFEQASVGIGIREISMNPRWLRVNRKLCEILGYSESELLQMTSLDITPESDRAETRERNTNLRAGELRNYSRQKRYQRKGGGIIWVDLSVAVVNGTDGKPQFLISIIHDITENVKSRELLKESETRYRQLFALTPLPMFLRRVDNLQFIDVNDACLATYGYTREEILTLTVGEIQVPEERERFMNSNKMPTATGTIESMRKKHMRKNGEIFDVEIFTSTVMVDAEKVRLTLVRDITEQQHSEQLLRDSERRVALALEGSGGAIFDWNVVTGNVYLSDQWNVILGAEAKEIHTTFSVLEQLVHLEDRELHGGAIVKLLKKVDRFHHSEYRVRAHSGGWVWIESRASVIERDAKGRALRVLGINIDITQRKEAEIALRERDAMLRDNATEIRTLNIDLERRVEQRTRALAAVNRELESFSYSVSHDLRAPLRSIDGFSQILLHEYSGALDDTARGYLTRVRAGSQRMARLIDDLLVLASVTRRKLQIRTCDVTALAREIAHELQRAEPGRQARISVADGLLVTADPGLLRIVLDNLLRNAWKFTSTKPEAVIEVGQLKIDGESTYFVKDNGVGFDMTYVNKLFGAFQRLHSDAEFQGTGIGLALVQRVIRRHGGHVRGEGVPDRGATFYFMLPEQSVTESEPVAKIAAIHET